MAIGNQILNLKSSILNTSVGRSLTAEHRIVNAYGEGSTPSDPPKSSTQEQEEEQEHKGRSTKYTTQKLRREHHEKEKPEQGGQPYEVKQTIRCESAA